MLRKAIVLSLIIISFGFTQPVLASCEISIDGKSNSELNQILAQCEAEIAAEKEKLKTVQREAVNLEQGIAELTYKVNQSELEIKKRNIKIRQLGDEISVKLGEIGTFEATIERLKDSLSEIVRETNNVGSQTAIEVILSSQNMSEFFIDMDSYSEVKEKLYGRMLEIKDLKKRAEIARAALTEAQAKEETERYLREKEKRQTEIYKSEQKRILDVTRSEEKAYKQLIADKEAKKQTILARMLNIGTTEITFGNALKLIQPYEARLGVDAALTLAVLTQETGVEGVIGANLGKCTYNQSAKNSSGTVMAPSQQKAFLSIIEELGMDPDKTPVSCPIYQDGAYGGAMGPSQFMPNTWLGFKDRVASVVGTSSVSPFNNRDAFVGTMLYLSDAMTRCRTVFTSQHDLWSCASAKYYAGLATSGSRLQRHMAAPSSYGYRVSTRAAQFQKDIDFLSL